MPLLLNVRVQIVGFFGSSVQPFASPVRSRFVLAAFVQLGIIGSCVQFGHCVGQFVSCVCVVHRRYVDQPNNAFKREPLTFAFWSALAL